MTTETILVDQFIAQPPAKVWEAITTSELLARWWVPGDIAPTVGHSFVLEMPGWGNVPARCSRPSPTSASSTPSPTGR